MIQINKRRFLLSIIIGVSAGVGDKNVFGNKENRLAAAVCDNFTHALIGLLTWLGVVVTEPNFKLVNYFMEYFFCALCSSVIDVDHFISAKSISLKDATNLSGRPFMHCTSGMISGIWIILSMSYFFNIPWLCRIGWILIAAVASHHIRDSNRRGFWLWPIGSTPPTPYWAYILAQMFLPYMLSFLMTVMPMKQVTADTFIV